MRLFITLCLALLLPICLVAGDFEDAMAAKNSGDFSKAVELFRKAAEKGEAWGQCGLGTRYILGQGVNQDFQEGMSLYQKAAAQGNASAQFCIGDVYFFGKGVKQDYQEAMSWYRKSADQGNADGQFGIGRLYLTGNGVNVDYQEAINWFRKSAAQGNVGAQVAIGYMYRSGSGVKQDYQEAMSWYRKAADQGNKDAKRFLSELEAEATTNNTGKFRDSEGNVREKPDSKAKLLFKTAKDEKFRILQREGLKWLKIELEDGRVGWTNIINVVVESSLEEKAQSSEDSLVHQPPGVTQTAERISRPQSSPTAKANEGAESSSVTKKGSDQEYPVFDEETAQVGQIYTILWKNDWNGYRDHALNENYVTVKNWNSKNNRFQQLEIKGLPSDPIGPLSEGYEFNVKYNGKWNIVSPYRSGEFVSWSKKSLEFQANKQREENEKAAKLQKEKDEQERANNELPSGVTYRPVGPKIKGLTIGMSLLEAKNVLKEKFQNSNVTIVNVNNYMTAGIDTLMIDSNPYIGINVKADSNKRVIAIDYNNPSELFNASDMSPQDFAKSIVDSYKIPELKPFFANGISGWEYSSPEGWKIKISQEKQLLLMEIAKSSERKFD